MKLSYNITPRYTTGEPAMLDKAGRREAERAARDELAEYLLVACGMRGDAAERRAKGFPHPIAGIVLRLRQQKDGFHVTDLITRQMFYWPFEAYCPGCRGTFDLQRGHIPTHADPGAPTTREDCRGSGLSKVREIH